MSALDMFLDENREDVLVRTGIDPILNMFENQLTTFFALVESLDEENEGRYFASIENRRFELIELRTYGGNGVSWVEWNLHAGIIKNDAPENSLCLYRTVLLSEEKTEKSFEIELGIFLGFMGFSHSYLKRDRNMTFDLFINEKTDACMARLNPSKDGSYMRKWKFAQILKKINPEETGEFPLEIEGKQYRIVGLHHYDEEFTSFDHWDRNWGWTDRDFSLSKGVSYHFVSLWDIERKRSCRVELGIFLRFAEKSLDIKWDL